MNPSNKGRKVFVFEETKQDVSKAGAFGNVVFLFGESRPRSALFECDNLSDEIISALEDSAYDPARDFICVTGHIVSIALLTAAVVAEYGRAKFLLYDAIQKTYHERALGYENASQERVKVSYPHLKKFKLVGGARFLERKRKRDDAEARAADRRAKAAAFIVQSDEAARVANAIDAALKIAGCPDWRKTIAGAENAEQRANRARAYREIAADCIKANRKDLAHTVQFIASEIDLGVGLGSYVNQEG